MTNYKMLLENVLSMVYYFFLGTYKIFNLNLNLSCSKLTVSLNSLLKCKSALEYICVCGHASSPWKRKFLMEGIMGGLFRQSPPLLQKI